MTKRRNPTRRKEEIKGQKERSRIRESPRGTRIPERRPSLKPNKKMGKKRDSVQKENE